MSNPSLLSAKGTYIEHDGSNEIRHHKIDREAQENAAKEIREILARAEEKWKRLFMQEN